MKLLQGKKILLLVLLFMLFTLALSELPYLNVLVTGKLWVIYLAMFIFLLFSRWFKPFLLIILAQILLLSGMVLIAFKLGFLAEFFGVAIYVFLWLALILQIFEFLQAGKTK